MNKYGTIFVGLIRRTTGGPSIESHRYTIEAASYPDGSETVLLDDVEPSNPVFTGLIDAELPSVGDPVLLIKRFDGRMFVYPFLTFMATENCP